MEEGEKRAGRPSVGERACAWRMRSNTLPAPLAAWAGLCSFKRVVRPGGRSPIVASSLAHPPGLASS